MLCVVLQTLSADAENCALLARSLEERRGGLPRAQLNLWQSTFVSVREVMRVTGVDVPTQSDLERLLSVIQNNAITMLTSDWDEVAVGLFASASMINHSCVPSTSWTFDGSKLVLHAAVQKGLSPGDAITVTYAHPLGICQPQERRIFLLNRRFGFKCGCEICQPKSEEEQRRALLIEAFRDGRPCTHPDCNGAATRTETPCVYCGKAVATQAGRTTGNDPELVLQSLSDALYVSTRPTSLSAGIDSILKT